ncbi:MAG: class I SAM-dependent methyltransferase [Desulfovibrio sp.]|nr:class I SAM-dependent methyltransferase [Desulfovibrio sp.]
MPILAYFLDRLPFGNTLKGISQAGLNELMLQSEASEWHKYAISNRKWRRHACTACRWLKNVLPEDASIHEPGCGSAANLLWLGQQGFRRLSGSDISVNALKLGQSLASLLSIPLDVWHDDCLNPARLPGELDGILSVNWLYHVPGASLGDFLARYRRALKTGGYLACDMVTRRYDHSPGNKWHTWDKALPEEERRPSEYTLRLDEEEVRCLSCRNGFAVVRSTCFTLCRPQRAVYLLRRVD